MASLLLLLCDSFLCCYDLFLHFSISGTGSGLTTQLAFLVSATYVPRPYT